MRVQPQENPVAKKAPTFESLRAEYRRLWDSIEIRPTRESAARAAAARILKHKSRYEAVAKVANVPWFLIGLLHYRESSNSFAKHLHNGDSLKKKTYRVPAGRPLKGDGPFTWEESAIDALGMKKLGKIGFWPIERIAYECERYNGWGYRWNKAGLAPYLWGGSTHYVKGKYVKDGVLDRNFVDPQLGTMTILAELAELDETIDLSPAAPSSVEVVKESKSLWSIVMAAVTWLATQFTTYLQSAWDSVVGGVAALPSLVTGAKEQVESSETLAGWLNVDWATTGQYIVFGILAFVFYRHMKDKKELTVARERAVSDVE
jgi:lysozyme family protein